MFRIYPVMSSIEPHLKITESAMNVRRHFVSEFRRADYPHRMFIIGERGLRISFPTICSDRCTEVEITLSKATDRAFIGVNNFLQPETTCSLSFNALRNWSGPFQKKVEKSRTFLLTRFF